MLRSCFQASPVKLSAWLAAIRGAATLRPPVVAAIGEGFDQVLARRRAEKGPDACRQAHRQGAPEDHSGRRNENPGSTHACCEAS
jgi:hypothetical protein